MTTRETPFTAGTPCWVDLQTAGLAAAATFYATVLGWELAEAGPGG